MADFFGGLDRVDLVTIKGFTNAIQAWAAGCGENGLKSCGCSFPFQHNRPVVEERRFKIFPRRRKILIGRPAGNLTGQFFVGGRPLLKGGLIMIIFFPNVILSAGHFIGLRESKKRDEFPDGPRIGRPQTTVVYTLMYFDYGATARISEKKRFRYDYFNRLSKQIGKQFLLKVFATIIA
jgi:hypothetical protein